MSTNKHNRPSGGLRISDLRLKLGRFTLGELALELEPGEYFVLMGPSGCGKTSLLRTIAGVYRKHTGSIAVGDRAISPLAPHKRRVGYVPQTASLFPHLSVLDNVRFGLAYQKIGAKKCSSRIDRVVKVMGIGHLLDRKPRTLSGGESRRVALARSVVTNPDILLLDEPLSMLDTTARSHLLDTLQRLHREINTVTIHVTHHCEEAWALNSRCGVMRDGRIIQTGAVDAVFRRPANRFVAEFLGNKNIFPATFVTGAKGREADLGWARLPLDRPVGTEQGFVHLRPETIRIVSDTAAASAPNGSFRGVVTHVTDRGIYVDVMIAVGRGAELSVHVTHQTTPPRAGTEVWLDCAIPPHAFEG